MEQSAVTLFMSQIYMSFDKTFFSESYCFIFINIFCFEIVFLFCCLFCIRSRSIRKNNQLFCFVLFFPSIPGKIWQGVNHVIYLVFFTKSCLKLYFYFNLFCMLYQVLLSGVCGGGKYPQKTYLFTHCSHCI